MNDLQDTVNSSIGDAFGKGSDDSIRSDFLQRAIDYLLQIMRQTCAETAIRTFLLYRGKRLLTRQFFLVKFKCPFTSSRARAGAHRLEPMPVEW